MEWEYIVDIQMATHNLKQTDYNYRVWVGKFEKLPSPGINIDTSAYRFLRLTNWTQPKVILMLQTVDMYTINVPKHSSLIWAIMMEWTDK